MKEESQDPKILLITYAFPSIKTISSIRNFNIARQFQKYFSEVQVLTTTNRKWFPKEEFPFDENLITASPTLDYRTINHSQKSSGVNTMPNDSKSFFVKLKGSFPFNLIIGLGGIFYIFFGVLLGILLVKKHKITHLFSSFKPYSDHVIAWWLKVFFPSLIWIADYNNLHYIKGENNLFWPKLQRWFDNKVASRADALTTVSEGLVEHLELSNKKVIVLENGMMRDISPPTPQKVESFQICYTGSLYPEQSIAILLIALKELIAENKIDENKIKLAYAGASSNLWNHYIKNENVEYLSTVLGVLPLKEAHQVQANSHLNLLLTWRTETLIGIIPAKFYDYLQSKNNILMLVRGGEDWVWEKKFEELNLTQNLFYDDVENLEALKTFLQKQYENWENEIKISINYPTSEFEGYYWDNLMKKFITELDKLDLR